MRNRNKIPEARRKIMRPLALYGRTIEQIEPFENTAGKLKLYPPLACEPITQPERRGPSPQVEWCWPPQDPAPILALWDHFKELGAPPPYVPPSSPAKLRRWAPAQGSQSTARIIAAREELGIEGAKVKPEPKVSRSGEEGWRGRAHSLKAGAQVCWKGRLVYAMIREADADPSISKLLMAPLTIEFYTQSGKKREYSPDMLVLRNGEPCLITCHREKAALARDDFWAEFGPACQALGFGFEVLTERYLEAPQRASNVKILWRAKQAPPPQHTEIAKVLMLAAEKPHTIRSLAESACISSRDIHYLIVHRYLSINLDDDFKQASVSPLQPGQQL